MRVRTESDADPGSLQRVGDDAALAAHLAQLAGEVLVARRRDFGGLGDRELRDLGDAAAQAALAAELARLAPGDAVLSEEAVDGPARLAANRVWIIDPLDGTREYAEGRDDFAVHVALWQGGELVAGAVSLPARDRVLTTVPGRDRAVMAERSAHAPLRLAVSRSRAPRLVHDVAERLGAELVPMGSAGVKAMAVVTGEVDAYLHAGGQYEWDSAAPVAVARAYGVHASRVDGSPLRYNRPDPFLPDLLVCRPELADLLLRTVAAVTGTPPGGRVMPEYSLSQVEQLEAESVFIIREVVAESEKPALLFSGGKDSIVMLELAVRAFWPAPIPFPVVHIDTGHNFPEVLAFRDWLVGELGVQLVVGSVQDAIDRGLVVEEPSGSRNRIQTPVLLETAARHGFTALLGGARRDEEKARAKERVFSFRDEFGQWDPKNQRPELWGLYNARVHLGESIRVFPLSNWTELDVWHYIAARKIEIPSIYYAHDREVFARNGMLFGDNEHCRPRAGETPYVERVRYRTVGDATLTAAVRSDAADVRAVIAEVAATRITERGATRGDDRVSEAAMEDRKKEGYF